MKVKAISILFLLLAILLMAGCSGSTSTVVHAQGPTPTPTPAATPTPAPTPNPTPTPAPTPSPTPAPSSNGYLNVSAYADTPYPIQKGPAIDTILFLPNIDGDWVVDTLAISSPTPGAWAGSGDMCQVTAAVMDGKLGITSQPVTLLSGGWSSWIEVNWTVPKGDNVGIVLNQSGNCSTDFHRVTVTALYKVQ